MDSSGTTVKTILLRMEWCDGVIHSWLNRMLLPDTVGTSGDSHTFSMDISFPAGSGL